MFATTWSKPIATNAMIGKKIARILPATPRSAASDIQTATQTSQLQPTRAQEGLPRSVVQSPCPRRSGARRSYVRCGAPGRGTGVVRSARSGPQEVGHEQGADQVPDQHQREIRRRRRRIPIRRRIALSGTSISAGRQVRPSAMGQGPSRGWDAGEQASAAVPQRPRSGPDETVIAHAGRRTRRSRRGPGSGA